MVYPIQVSVICVTYNHEKYIRQALDSILMQKTTFPFEIRVGEDCSTDRTREILKEYEEKYPDKFIMYYREKNLGATRNEYELFMDARGKYIAALELDDIWSDEYKLQKQYDFLETHQEYIGVSHDFDIIDKENQILDNDDNKKIKDFFNKSFTLSDFLNFGFVFQTGTHFYRNIFKDGKDYSIIYTADNMSAYRRFFEEGAQNGRNMTTSNLELDFFTKAKHVEALNQYFEGRIDYSKQWSNIIVDYIKHLLKKEKLYTVERALYMYRHANKKTRKEVRRLLTKSVTNRLPFRKKREKTCPFQ